MMTVGAINLRAMPWSGSGSMYQPFLVRIKNGSVAVVVTESMCGRSSSSALKSLHSTSQPSSVPIRNGVGGEEEELTTTSVMGTEAGEILS